MLKNITQLEHIIEGKSYKFMCDIDANIPAIKDALFQFMKFVGQIEDQIKAKKEEAHPVITESSLPVTDEVKAS